jgi:hypothetical protein
MGGIHIVICLQDYALEREFITKAGQLGSIHGVATRCNDGNGTRIVWLCPGRCGDDIILHLSNDDANMPICSSTSHWGGCYFIYIYGVSCDLDVLKWRLVVYLGEEMIGESIDDLLNRERIARRHVCWLMRAAGS